MGDSDTELPLETLSLGDERADIAQTKGFIRRAQIIIDELDEFLQILGNQPRRVDPISSISGLGNFIREVRTEKSVSERMLQKQTDQATVKPPKYSSNLISIEARWNAIKRCRHLTAMGQFYRRNALSAKDFTQGCVGSEAQNKFRIYKKKDSTLVDAVVESGSEWIRVCTVSEKRLLQEISNNGWDSESDDEDASQGTEDDGDDDAIGIVKIIRHLVQASRQNGRPRIRLVLPRLIEGEISQVDAVLSRIRRMGGSHVQIIVNTANSDFLTKSLPPTHKVLEELVSDNLAQDKSPS